MRITSFLSIAIIAVLFGCKGSTPTTPQGATGTLTGTVGLYDAHGNQIADKSGVVITAEGSSLSAVSDTGGNWVINGLPAQTYTITFSKTGYGTVKNTSFVFSGADTVSYGKRVYLYQPVNFTITIDSVSSVFDTLDRYGNYGYISGHISGALLADSTIIQAYVLIGNSPNLTLGDTTTFFGGLLFNDERHSLHKKGSDLLFETTNWEVCGPDGWAKHGTTAYLQAFGITNSYSPRYYDSLAGKWIYPNPAPASNIVKAIIP